METAATLAACLGKAVFGYNRANFMYDRDLRQEAEYQVILFRLEQAKLWREDIRDITGLTMEKMDKYFIVTAMELSFCVMAFCEGRLKPGTPTWLVGCHMISLTGAIMYLLMSVWLAMQATVAAKSYEAKLLTQNVRLPVPAWFQLEGARTYASSFEKVDARQVFRVPFVGGTQAGVMKRNLPSNAQSKEHEFLNRQGEQANVSHERRKIEGTNDGQGEEMDSCDCHGVSPCTKACHLRADPWGLELSGENIHELQSHLRSDLRKSQHIRLVQLAMHNWQSYDAFARAAMSLGGCNMVNTLAYYILGYVLVSNQAVCAAWMSVLLLMVMNIVIVRLDMSLMKIEFCFALLLLTSGPIICGVCVERWSHHTAVSPLWVKFLSPLPYFCHAGWMAFLVRFTGFAEEADHSFLPDLFRSVLYINVFGWIKKGVSRSTDFGSSTSLPKSTSANRFSTGAGPAVQAVYYENGNPVASRPEDLSSASRPAPCSFSQKQFVPTIFMPKLQEDEDEKDTDGDDPHYKPMRTPWIVFCGASVLLGSLWFVIGLFVIGESFGLTPLKVWPLLRDWEDTKPSGIKMEDYNLRIPTESIHRAGIKMTTVWPHADILLHDIACNEHNGLVVALSRFNVFQAQGLTESSTSIKFLDAPLCNGIEGHSLQDVSLECKERACKAQILHGNGQLLTTCAMDSAMTGQMPATQDITEDWHIQDGLAQEKLASFVPATNCSFEMYGRNVSEAQCAYGGTNLEHILELQLATDLNRNGRQMWFPTRMIQAGGSGGVPHTKIFLIARQYLGRMQGGVLKVIDLATGHLKGRWMLPAGKWVGACTGAHHIYLLPQGPNANLHRFPLPFDLLPENTDLLQVKGVHPNVQRGLRGFTKEAILRPT